jgi:hypothetical protein
MRRRRRRPLQAERFGIARAEATPPRFLVVEPFPIIQTKEDLARKSLQLCARNFKLQPI